MTGLFQPVGLFADRDTMQEAVEYIDKTLVPSVRQSGRMAVYTAAYVLYNTAAKLANAEIAKRDELLRRAADRLQELTCEETDVSDSLSREIYKFLGDWQ